jgi:hypothetical protein
MATVKIETTIDPLHATKVAVAEPERYAAVQAAADAAGQRVNDLALQIRNAEQELATAQGAHAEECKALGAGKPAEPAKTKASIERIEYQIVGLKQLLLEATKAAEPILEDYRVVAFQRERQLEREELNRLVDLQKTVEEEFERATAGYRVAEMKRNDAAGAVSTFRRNLEVGRLNREREARERGRLAELKKLEELAR